MTPGLWWLLEQMLGLVCKSIFWILCKLAKKNQSWQKLVGRIKINLTKIQGIRKNKNVECMIYGSQDIGQNVSAYIILPPFCQCWSL